MNPALAESLMPWLRQIEAGSLATYVRTSTFAYPAIEIAHIVGLSALFGSVLLVDLAVLARHRRFPLEVWGVAVLRLTLVGFVLAALTGSLMLIARATDIALNPAFGVKMLLLVVAGLNAWLFHRRRGLEDTGPGARFHALISIGVWIAVIACGRMIAYV